MKKQPRKTHSVPYEYSNKLIDLFEQHVTKTPENPAIYFEDCLISYQDLNRSANQLAHYIHQADSKGDQNIVIYLDRNPQLIICLLAILKSNNVYIPIDIEAPISVVKEIIKDSKPFLVIVSSEIDNKIIQIINDVNAKIINLDVNNTALQKMPLQNLHVYNSCENAYILYTSGTTGKPKGVIITHKALDNLICAMKNEVDFTRNDITLAITPITFDLSVPDIYLPLTSGSCFVLANSSIRFNPNAIIYSIGKFGVTVMQATPTTWLMLIESGWKNESHIKAICGGEALSVHLAKKLRVICENVWNFYGPTETTVWSTCYKIQSIDDSNPVISIGKPLKNTTVYVLDNLLNPKPVGESGELYIGGEGVGAGYLNRPQLNNKYFISNPFSAEKNSKLYKTGDLVKLDAEGNLHYLGRIDTQIKIRGHRIEASAIENVLIDLQGIKDCVVIDKSPAQIHELVAYLILDRDGITLKELQEHLKSHFPKYMIPTRYVVVDNFPVTANGKIDRKNIANIKKFNYLDHEKSNSKIENKYEEILLDLIQSFLQREDVDPESNFFDLGLHSMLLVNIAQALNRILNQHISVVDLFEHPTIRDFANFLIKTHHIDYAKLEDTNQKSLLQPQSSKTYDNHIAVIGMACKVPGADTYKELWDLILQQQETIQFFNTEELQNSGVPSQLYNSKDYVAARGILKDIDQFDAGFFNYTPSEARIMDPQHRVFLEQAWSALEDAGYSANSFSGKIGVYAGMNDSSYLSNHLLQNSQIKTNYDSQQLLLATSTHYLATKVAYSLGLTGPSVTVNTACSTGLVSIAMACNSLMNHDTDMVMAGAVTIVTPQQSGYLYQDLGILSPDGHCRVFDERAQGTVLSNGCGVVVLRRLSDALKDNDHIFGVIKGWSVNNDGANKVGFTAPSIDGQIKCIKEALARAEISPTEVEYIEAHGTGTRMGDPIEIASLSKAYEYGSHQKSQYCALGSVKANIGHTDSASGAIGFIKTILTLYHKILPPQINYTKGNANIDFERSPYYVNCEKRTWETAHKKRTAAVHSLGFGGTNAHTIVQEAPQIKTTHSKNANLVILSAKSEYSLYANAAALHQHILDMLQANCSDKDLADLAYTLQMGRQAFKWRVAIPYQSYEHLLTVLHTPDALKKYVTPPKTKKTQRVIFGFVGQGAQYAGMAWDIYREHPYFKQIVDECCMQLQPDLGIDLSTLLFPKNSEDTKYANEQLSQTQYTQPALFIIEYALAKLLMSFNVQPDAMIGHSIGEYVAATLSGVLSLHDALQLITQRGQLMGSTESGDMLVVPLSVATIRPHLNSRVELAAHNAPNLCVVAGASKDLAQFKASIEALLPPDLMCKTLHTSHAFHSYFMEPICDKFYDIGLQYAMSEPKIPYVSNVSGEWISHEDLADKHYWTQHLRQTVLFSKGLDSLDLNENDVFIEIGPGRILSQLIRQHSFSTQPLLLSTMPPANEASHAGYEYLMRTIGQLWLAHLNINWEHLYTNEIRQRCSLPTYAFERQSYWVEPSLEDSPINKYTHHLFYKLTWKRERKISTHGSAAESAIKKCLLIFCNDQEKHHFLSADIQEKYDAYVISYGKQFQILEQQFIVNPAEKNDYVRCLKSIQKTYDEYEVIHTWFLDESTNDTKKCLLSKGPFSLLQFTQAMNEVCTDKPLKILIVTNQVYSVFGNEDVEPAKATILGPCKVIPQEQHHIAFKLIDLEGKQAWNSALITSLLWELSSISHSDFKKEIAYRGEYRWIKRLEPCDAEIQETRHNRLRKQGVYLITGGLGGIGLSIAEHLAKNYQSNIVLITRNEFPAENLWHSYADEEDSHHNKIKKLLEIKKHANTLVVKNAAVEDFDQLKAVIDSVKKKFSQIHGVIHAAGVAGGGLAQLKHIETYEDVLRPKLDGTANLIRCLKDEPLDVMVLVSSITAVNGFPGQIDYCSANCVLDAYANKNNNFSHPVFCVAMNWLAWREVGMAAQSKTLLMDLNESNSISSQEGCEFFEKIINSDFSQVVIAKEDLNHYEIPLMSSPISAPLTSDKSSVIDILLTLWQQTLGIEDIDIDDDFYEKGGHSLLAVSLISKIRQQFDIKIPSTTLFQVKTIRGLATIIESYKQENETYSPLVVLKQGDPSQPPLFMVHPVGGTVFCYMQLASLLDTDRTIYAFQDPSIEAEKSLFSTIEEMAIFYLEHIKKIQKHGPYYLCGASFGALVVAEIAYQLEQKKEQVNFIGVIDGWGKHGKVDFDTDYVRQIIHHHHPDQNNSDFEKQTVWESLLHHRLNMMLHYTYKSLQSPMVLFKAEDLLPEYKEMNAPDNHWAQYAYDFLIVTVPGDHNSMMQEPHIAVLGREMSLSLK